MLGYVGHAGRDSPGKVRRSEDYRKVRAADGVIEYIDPRFKDKVYMIALHGFLVRVQLVFCTSDSKVINMIF